METSFAATRALSNDLHRALELVREWDVPEEHRPALSAALDAADIVRTLDTEEDLVIATAVQALARVQAIDREMLSRRFGAVVANLVRDLIALGNFSLPLDWNSGKPLSANQSESLRKMLIAMVADVRLVLVRLAEQLQKMRTAKHLPLESQRRLAVETREIHAPLANRLGVWQLKWELEDLSFRILEPENYMRIAAALNSSRADREHYLRDFEAALAQELRAAGIQAALSARPKHIYSIWRKMQRKAIGFDRLMDIRAVRVLVDDVAQCYAALGVVHSAWQFIPREFDDYIATPKDNSYRSIHTAVFGPGAAPIEVQIRTHAMHKQSERGIASHWRYKEGGRSDLAYERKINQLRALLAPRAADDPAHAAPDFLDRMRIDLFQDRIYTLTPKGEIVDVPLRGTPLDFAYQVHTELGHRTRGAKLNGRMVPLNHHLKNGDSVEILTAKEPRPSRDWLSARSGFLASARHRAKVKAWFRQRDQEALKAKEGAAAEREENKPARANAARARTPVDSANESVHGIGSWLSTYAKCCGPVPPEPIGGYIAIGRGVSIHASRCANYIRLSRLNPARVLALDWGASSRTQFPVHVEIRAVDRHGLVRDVSSLIAEEKISIQSMETVTNAHDRIADMRMTVLLSDLTPLAKILGRIAQLPNVLSAKRVRGQHARRA